jgi:MFS family permease
VTRKRLLVDISPLRESPAFRRLWAGSTLSTFGSMITGFAVALQVFWLTGSSLAVGGVGMAMAVPAIVFGLFGGAVADHMDRRKLVLITSTTQAVISAALVAQAFAHLERVWLLYALVAASSLVNSIDGPVRRTFLPRLLPPERVPAGAALNMLAVHSSVTAGPIVAGLVVAKWGLAACYLIDAITFFGALYGLIRLPSLPPEGEIKRFGLHSISEGLGFIARSRVIAGAFLADINATALGMPFALFPAINADHFGGSSSTLGLLSAAPAVGGIIGSSLSGPVGRVVRQGRAILFATVVWGVSLTCFGIATSLWVALAMLMIAGTADVISVIFRTTVVQLATPDAYRGRVSAAEYVVGTGVPQLGNFRAGAVASLTSPATSAISGGLAVVAGAALIGITMPTFRKFEKTPEPATVDEHETAVASG